MSAHGPSEPEMSPEEFDHWLAGVDFIQVENDYAEHAVEARRSTFDAILSSAIDEGRMGRIRKWRILRQFDKGLYSGRFDIARLAEEEIKDYEESRINIDGMRWAEFEYDGRFKPVLGWRRFRRNMGLLALEGTVGTAAGIELINFMNGQTDLRQNLTWYFGSVAVVLLEASRQHIENSED